MIESFLPRGFTNLRTVLDDMFMNSRRIVISFDRFRHPDKSVQIITFIEMYNQVEYLSVFFLVKLNIWLNIRQATKKRVFFSMAKFQVVIADTCSDRKVHLRRGGAAHLARTRRQNPVREFFHRSQESLHLIDMKRRRTILLWPSLSHQPERCFIFSQL